MEEITDTPVDNLQYFPKVFIPTELLHFFTVHSKTSVYFGGSYVIDPTQSSTVTKYNKCVLNCLKNKLLKSVTFIMYSSSISLNNVKGIQKPAQTSQRQEDTANVWKKKHF